MIGIDTNVLLRYLIQDHPDQSALASQFIDSLTSESPGFVSLVTLAEVYWVLDHSFKLSKHEILEILEELTLVESLRFEHHNLVPSALISYATGKSDFDDHLIAIASRQAGCMYVVSFDKDAAKDGLMRRLS